MNYSNFKQGTIVLTDVRFTDLDKKKSRPALIMSNNNYNAKSSDMILFKITSRKKHWLFDVPLTQKNLIKGKLHKESVIKADFPIVINRTRIKGKIAKVDKKIIKEVTKKLNEAIKN